MKIATVTLRSDSPMAQGRAYDQEVAKLPKELPKDYEERTWRHKMHFTSDGTVFISPMALKNCLSEAAKFNPKKIPGQRNATYTKHFEAGVMVREPVMLAINKDDVVGQWLFVPADGVRGSSKRVWKCFPVIQEWQGVARYFITDDLITQDVFTQVLTEAGMFIGLGSLRIRNNGYFGMFTPIEVKWESV